jgi:hypothetical protein
VRRFCDSRSAKHGQSLSAGPGQPQNGLIENSKSTEPKKRPDGNGDSAAPPFSTKQSQPCSEGPHG